MSAYLTKLKEAANAQQHDEDARRAEQNRLATNAARDRLVPLEVRVSRLLAEIPIDVQREGLSLVSLQAQLRPRGRGHSGCHVGELGAALRRLGFRRERRWHGDAEAFQALWFPK